MAKVTPLQSSFSSGEIAPLLYGRVDANGYQSGAEVMENFIADSRGPARSRVGTQFIRKFTGNDGRIFLFPTTETSGYAIVLTDQALTPLSYEGEVPATNYVTNPRFRSGSSDWTTSIVSGSATFNPDDLIMICNDSANAVVRVGQQVTVPAAGNYRVAVGSLTGQPYRIKVGTALNDGTYADYTVPGGFSSELVALPGTTAWVTVINETRDSRVDINGFFVLSTVPVAPTATPWREEELPDVQVIFAPGGDVAYLLHPNHQPRKLTYSYSTDTFTFASVTFTNKPASWTGNSWPRCGTFHQGRLWLGGVPTFPQTFWASKSNDYENFTVGSLANDALVFTLSRKGDLRWMISTKNLLLGTNLGEHIVTAEGGVITPSDIEVTQQSAYGSTRLQALQVGDQVFYVSPDRTKVRAMQYEWTADNWLSNDITFFSNHITRRGITTFAWAQNPDNQLMCTLEDGTFAALTYERGENIFGWHRHDMGNEVRCVATGPVRGEDVIMMLVNRNPDELYFEIMRKAPANYMDSWVQRTFITPATLVNGLSHLEGRDVQVTIDGAVHPERTVTSGEITLDTPANVVVVGLPFTARLKTLPLDKGAQTGSAQPYTKGYSRIYVRLLDSANPLIDGERQPVRSPSTPMNTPEPLTSGVSEVARRGWDRNAQITIEQDLPLPCTIVAIAAEMAQEIT